MINMVAGLSLGLRDVLETGALFDITKGGFPELFSLFLFLAQILWKVGQAIQAKAKLFSFTGQMHYFLNRTDK